MNYVEKIAKIDKSERRDALLDMLRLESIPFAHYRQKYNGKWVENIIVSVNPSEKRLVIGAHYDNIEGSTGANDNAAGVSVLIRLAKFLLEKGDNSNISADLVFFDYEEYGKHGSAKYIEFVGKDSISAMINLDVCGYGENICVHEKGNKDNKDFLNMFSCDILQKHNVNIMDYLPNGDDDSFANADIPNISVSMLPNSDVDIFQSFHQERTDEEWSDWWSSIDVMLTMHKGDKDYIDSVSQASMDILLSYLCDGITE